MSNWKILADKICVLDIIIIAVFSADLCLNVSVFIVYSNMSFFQNLKYETANTIQFLTEFYLNPIIDHKLRFDLCL